jgi:uncharacterized membrane protein (UPF0127 family)
MRVVHESEAGRRVLASNVDRADDARTQILGLMFRDSLPEDYALVFEFENPFDGLTALLPTDGRLAALADWLPVGGSLVRAIGSFFLDDAAFRAIHMLFVRMPLDVVWLADGEVVKVRTMHPWRSVELTWCDTVVELPAGAADGVDVGDQVSLESGRGRPAVDRYRGDESGRRGSRPRRRERTRNRTRHSRGRGRSRWRHTGGR